MFFLFKETDNGEHLSRRKSLKESIRRSFRRLRSRRGSRGAADRTPKKEGEAPASPTPEAVASPVSRLVEENRVDESVLSMVRCLYFVDTYIRDGKKSLFLLVLKQLQHTQKTFFFFYCFKVWMKKTFFMPNHGYFCGHGFQLSQNYM